MFALIWVSLLLFVGGSSANTSASMRNITHCHYLGYCITVPDGPVPAEAGLCAVIPCSFVVPRFFKPQSLVWSKCDTSTQQCEDRILHKNNRDIQPEFRGRVSLLESDIKQLNCSIVINDLKESDSGVYRLRVNGFKDNKYDGFNFPLRPSISVKGLQQKPTLEAPLMTAGQEATLTCTAPGLCSGSTPGFTWTWSGVGGNISGSVTAFWTEDLTAIARRHSSTLTFNASTELHGAIISCEISLTGSITTEETVMLNVTYLKEVEITGNTTVKEGEALNLTCSVESFPPSHVTWMKSDDVAQNASETNTLNETLAESLNETEPFQQGDEGGSSLFIANVTSADSGQYVCRVKHENITLMERVNVTVRYSRKPQITGNTTVTRGDPLSLSCSVQSVPPSLVMWTKLGDNETLQSNSGSAALVIPSVAPEDSGQYVCTVTYLDTTSTLHADVAVTWISSIRSSSCVSQSDVLTCTCISDGFPLPTIQWPMLQNRTEYSFVTSVSHHTVNSTISMSTDTLAVTTVECVGGNENGEVKESVPVQMKSAQKDGQLSFKDILRLEILLAFVIGVLLSTFICCSAFLCYRRRKKSSANSEETVELVADRIDPKMYNGHAGQEEAESGPELDSGHKNVEYADIDFSRLKQKSPNGGARNQESTETEYAEIKKEAKEESGVDGGEQRDALQGKEEEVMMEEEEEEEEEKEEEEQEEEEMELHTPEDDGGEVEAVYSNVKDVMKNV